MAQVNLGKIANILEAIDRDENLDEYEITLSPETIDKAARQLNECLRRVYNSFQYDFSAKNLSVLIVVSTDFFKKPFSGQKENY